MKGATKILLIFIVVVVVVLVGYALLKSRTQAPTTNYGTPPAVTPPAATTPAPTTKIPEIAYSGAAYSPQSMTITAGDTVKFVNRSAAEMWPASAMHPTHAVYPTTGGCIGSTFDACAGIKPSQSWLFQFDVKGSWKYHDHLNPTAFGTVVVE